jgi:hypothetical protein
LKPPTVHSTHSQKSEIKSGPQIISGDRATFQKIKAGISAADELPLTVLALLDFHDPKV